VGSLRVAMGVHMAFPNDVKATVTINCPNIGGFQINDVIEQVKSSLEGIEVDIMEVSMNSISFYGKGNDFISLIKMPYTKLYWKSRSKYMVQAVHWLNSARYEFVEEESKIRIQMIINSKSQWFMTKICTIGSFLMMLFMLSQMTGVTQHLVLAIIFLTLPPSMFLLVYFLNALWCVFVSRRFLINETRAAIRNSREHTA
jgi:hypothetical protein